jgi:hypothetical protein
LDEIAIDLLGYRDSGKPIGASALSLGNFALIGVVLLTFADCDVVFLGGALRMSSEKIYLAWKGNDWGQSQGSD